MRFKSETCFGRTGASLNAYDLESEAAEHARYLKFERGSVMVPYECDRCGFWHLSPAERQTSSTVCGFCRDRNGGSKDLYATKQDAERRAQISLTEKKVNLSVYKCPHQNGWHLTKGTPGS
jgi:hypothetical protein